MNSLLSLLKFEIPATRNRERVTANCSCCGLCFPMKNQMLKVCISAVTSNNLKRENHNPGPGQGVPIKKL